MTTKELDIRHFHRTRYDIGSYVPERYKDAHIAKIKMDKSTQKKVLDWTVSDQKFLIFLGCAGCGKTYFSIALGKYLLDQKTFQEENDVYKTFTPKNEKGAVIGETRYTNEIIGKAIFYYHPNIIYYPITKLYDEFKKCYSNNEDDLKLKDELFNLDYLLIDDLGAMRNNEWQVQTIYEILDARYNNHKPTIITSNFTFDQIENAFHSRLRSRLEATENLVIFDWDTDLRSEGF